MLKTKLLIISEIFHLIKISIIDQILVSDFPEQLSIKQLKRIELPVYPLFAKIMLCFEDKQIASKDTETTTLIQMFSLSEATFSLKQMLDIGVKSRYKNFIVFFRRLKKYRSKFYFCFEQLQLTH